MAQNTLVHARPAAPLPRLIDRGSWVAIVRRGRALVRLWLRRARTRRALAELDERLLRDVGRDPMTARKEARLPFWRTSSTVRR